MTEVFNGILLHWHAWPGLAPSPSFAGVFHGGATTGAFIVVWTIPAWDVQEGAKAPGVAEGVAQRAKEKLSASACSVKD